MGTIGPSLREFLLEDADIRAAVDGTRIYPVQLPQKFEGTSIRYTHISGRRVVSTTRDLGLSAPRIQIDVWATDYKSAAVLADRILARLSAFQGYMDDNSPPTQFVQGAFFDNERDGFEPETRLYFFSRDYFIWFEDPLS